MAIRAGATTVGFVGADDLSLELAIRLSRHGFNLQAFSFQSARFNDEFQKLGGRNCGSIDEAAKDAAALLVLMSHGNQTQNLTSGDVGGLQKGAVLILYSTEKSGYEMTLQPYVKDLEKQLAANAEHISLVHAFVYREFFGLHDGALMIISSGKSEAIQTSQPFLEVMCDRLHTLEGDIDAASKVGQVNELLQGIHFFAAVEAISLGIQAGINPWIIYDIISNAAGNSWVFKNLIPLLLRGDGEHLQIHRNHNLLASLSKNLGTVLAMAQSLKFPVPLLAVVYQQVILWVSHLGGDDNDASLVKVWESILHMRIREAANAEVYEPAELAKDIVYQSKPVVRIGFIGLGAMGFGMATHLLTTGFSVVGYDVYKPTLVRFQNAGGLTANSPAEVSKGVEVLVIMVTNEVQAEDVLFGEFGAVQVLPSGASIVLASTVSPGYVTQLEQRLQNEGKDFKLVDAPVSGGVKRASNGKLTIMASGQKEALTSVGLVLSALSEKLYIIKGGCGAGSVVKMVNQLLAGVHIASGAEALAFGARLGLNTRKVFDVISRSEGTSWMFENRVPHMLDNDYTPYSALDIFVKDLGIVTREGSVRKVPLHVSTMAHQLFLSGSAAGWGRLDDAAVVKVYETLTGVAVEGRLPVLKKKETLQALPPEWPMDLTNDIIELNKSNLKTLVVLDDDPTGTQTVYDIEVLTQWSVESISEQFRKRPVCFFILTNSRSLSAEKASAMIKEICINLCTAAKEVPNTNYTVVLRGDSTLRGHFPEEAEAAGSVLGEMDAWIVCPFFLQGGRYTIEDVHYVADSNRLVPAGETEFAKDASFGYKSSNLCEWIEEKTGGRVPTQFVTSISIQILRHGGPEAVCKLLCSLKKGSTCIVNAASDRDMAVFALGMIKAEKMGKSFLCRTAASFVSARIGIVPKSPVLPKDLGIQKQRSGGLIVVGSYVPKTTKQVDVLQSHCGPNLKTIEVSVDKVALKSSEEREVEISTAADMADIYLQSHKDILIMSSRELITGRTPSESLEINSRVSSALVEIIRRISTRPRYILAKGGITSSDIATRALDARRALVVGQALAGVPLWQLGPESRHPGVPYIVFPGNVGDSNSVAEVVKSWALSTRSSTKEILINAEKGKYAVGAFNIYNLEGVQAVVAAAEEENSPAILQIHPAAFKQGGFPLLACCVSAAEQAKVPISVHFDHGTSKQDLVEALEMELDSVMVDGSHLPYQDNILYTKFIATLAHSKNVMVEAELGRLSGTEDDLTVEDYDAKLTDPHQAEEFIDHTGIDALAVCIGNVHGKYPPSGPKLRLDLLQELHEVCSKRNVHLVLHGASGLPEELIQDCIERGVRKFNVNTEVRKAYTGSLAQPVGDLVHVMASAKEAMKAVVAEKLRLFGCAGRA